MCIWSRLRREKKPERNRKNLIRLGVPSGKTYAWSRSKKGRWAIAQSPILLTTITTVVGMIPLSRISDFWSPLAFAIMFGLTFAMILTLILVPTLYYRNEVKKQTRHNT